MITTHVATRRPGGGTLAGTPLVGVPAAAPARKGQTMTENSDPPVNPARGERNGGVGERADAAVDRAGEVVERAGDAVELAAQASGRIASAVVERLRNDAEFTADRGTTRIEDEVVEKIAGIAAREVPGVHDLGGDTTRFFAAVRERVGLGDGDQGNRGVSVRLGGDQARIGVTLVVEYGVRVHPVTAAVRAGVIKAVESMLDLKVSEVDIVVDDVHVPDRPGS
jgi:uncharacterized alkaline shock family protein YloU